MCILRTLYLTLLFGIFLSSCSNSQENKIVENNSSVDTLNVKNEIPKFEVVFPKTKYQVKKKVSNAVNAATSTNWLLEGEDENGPFMYFVAHDKLPKEIENLKGDPNLLNISLQAMLTGSAEKLGGFDFEYSKKDYHGHTGMASKCKVFEGEGMIKSIVYLIDKDIFIISGGGKKINEDSLNVFLASFELK